MTELDRDSPAIREMFARHGIPLDANADIELPPGWLGLLGELLGALKAAGWHGRMEQVKQKMGKLRCYVDDSAETDEVVRLLDAFEERSTRVCQDCGGSGEQRIAGGVRTTCSTCLHRSPYRPGDR